MAAEPGRNRRRSGRRDGRADQPPGGAGSDDNVHELFGGVDGLLTEEQLRRLRMQGELQLDLRSAAHDLAMKIRNDHDEARRRERDDRYEFELRCVLDSDHLDDRRWHSSSARIERWDRHLLEMIRESASAGQRVLALVVAVAVVYAFGRANALERILNALP